MRRILKTTVAWLGGLLCRHDLHAYEWGPMPGDGCYCARCGIPREDQR
ncbi:hypothetical protein [Pseudoxanthomonas sp. JBR18]|nr:hypothetical protein [Pseudoxanthomonas sp. JBR18]WCE04439.1 hypothetical protein PJ250_00045 [Pseudoxanthomonas sp. JBR18]